MISSELQEIVNRITIPREDAVRGNLYLPESVDEATVAWTSSRPEIISDKAVGALAAGVVSRTGKTETVELTAVVTLGSETAEKRFSVTVLPAPDKDDDYTGYLFGHFIGEENEDGEQIYFALSENGLHFHDLNGGQPVLRSGVGECGVRDPYLCRSKEGDRYFLIATDLSIFRRGGWFQNEQGYYDASTTGSPYLILWESTDLVHWSEPRKIPAAPKNAGMAWAPEMIYYEETGEYIIFFASSIMNPETRYKAKPNAIYYVTTRDFEHFSEPGLFIDNQTDGATDGKPREIIDTTVLRVGDMYYSVSKDGDNAEKNGGIRLMKTRTPLVAESWEKVLDLDELGLTVPGYGDTLPDNGFLEGPELFLLNRNDRKQKDVPEYGLIADQYAVGAGYLPILTTDLEDRDNSGHSWRFPDASEFSFDRLKKRHGTILPVTQKEIERLRNAFGKTTR